MNILFLNSAKKWGGNEHWMYLASKALSQDHKVFLAYRCAEVGDRFGIKKLRLPFKSELDIFTLFKLFLLIRRNKIEILIPTKQKDYFLAGIIAKISGTKNIIRLGIVRNLHNKWINNLVYNKLCNGIIVNANQIKQELLKSEFMSEGKIRVIYNGIDIEEINLKSKQEIERVLPFPVNIVASGELSKRKNFDFLIRAYSQFIENNSEFRHCGLIILGAGAELNNLKTLCKELGVSGNVLFFGFVPNPYPIIRKCDIFVSTSQNEGISNAILEALVLKKPVISSKAGGISEFITHGQNGFIVQGENIEELSSLFEKVLSEETIKNKISIAGWRTVNQIFNINKMKKEIVEFCTTID